MYLISKRLGVLQDRSWFCRKEEFFSLSGIESHFFGHPSHNLITIISCLGCYSYTKPNITKKFVTYNLILTIQFLFSKNIKITTLAIKCLVFTFVFQIAINYK
jgi:hypothetical protein